MIAYISLIILGLSFFLFRKASGGLSIRQPNVVTIFFIAVIVYQYIGSFVLVNSFVTNNWWVSRANNPETGIIWAHISILSILIITPLTVIGVFKLIGFKPKTEFPLLYTRNVIPIESVSGFLKIGFKTKNEFPLLYTKNIIPVNSVIGSLKQVGFKVKTEFPLLHSKNVLPINRNDDRQAFIWLLSATIIVFLALGYLIYSVKAIPILEVLKGGDDLLIRSARIESSEDFLSRLINGIFGRWIAPVLLFTIFGYYSLKKNSKYFLLFLTCFMAVFFISTFRTEKAPVIHLIFMLVLLQAVYNGHVKIKVLAKYGIFSFIILIFMYVYFMGVETIGLAAEAIFSRIFLSQHVGTVLAFDYFPDIEGFTGGKRILPFSSFLFGADEVRSFALKMMEHYNPSAWDAGLVGYLSTSFVAEGYSYWGYIGIPLSSMIVGVFLSLISYFSVRLNKNPITVALVVYLMYRVPFMLNSGLNIAIYSTELIATLLFFSVIVFLLRGELVIKLKNKYKIS